MDLRDVRKAFLGRRFKYACSYDPQVVCDVAESAEGLKVFSRRERSIGAHGLGAFFHVLDASSVEGVDARRHEVPVGEIQLIDETISFPPGSRVGDIDGRLTMRTRDRAIIDMTYSGKLGFRSSAWGGFVDVVTGLRVEANVWVVPVFATTDSRYRWLADRGCIAFGAWVARGGGGARGDFAVEASLDVYSCG